MKTELQWRDPLSTLGAAVLVMGILWACTPAASPMTDAGDASVGALPSCPAACTQLRALGCREGSPSASGESCEALCARAAASMMSLPVACVAGASTVEDVRGCGVRCQMVDAGPGSAP